MNESQFAEFAEDTGYITEAEQFGWSFVLQHLASNATIKEVDSDLGRVKASHHLQAAPSPSIALSSSSFLPGSVSDRKY